MVGYQILSEAISSNNFLYHYSAAPRKEILTLEAQGKITEAEKLDELKAAKFRSQKHPYYKHVSLTFDELPFDIIMQHYPNTHPVYKKNTTLYKHTIDVRNLPDMYWMVVESPLDTFMSDHLWMSHDWWKRVYFKMKRAGKIITRHEGKDIWSLKYVMNKYSGTYRDSFERLVNRADFNKLSHMYAPTVPHVFLYPPYGKIEPNKIEPVRL